LEVRTEYFYKMSVTSGLLKVNLTFPTF